MYIFPNIEKKILTTIYNKLDYKNRDKSLYLSIGGHIGLFAFRPPEGFPTLYAVYLKLYANK